MERRGEGAGCESGCETVVMSHVIALWGPPGLKRPIHTLLPTNHPVTMSETRRASSRWASRLPSSLRIKRARCLPSCRVKHHHPASQRGNGTPSNSPCSPHTYWTTQRYTGISARLDSGFVGICVFSPPVHPSIRPLVSSSFT